MHALGAVIFGVGICLIVGNVTGKFRTFPFAGYITTVIGGAIMRAG